ncbi:sensor histidine kinase [Lyngbya confervoides]|uniref:Circadian input-output histidine kinase CikA n=1 Tax=Lyngbya confervoides BDU141951 TaxID=1574623 RepID=A0ABD4T8E2_9CYAN|nr:HAMP domain-containing sensor histidine kinase [Lyngbya confervoides]MCM1985059.1 HAMP domain-containing histidine kinase [Lyngbya confervoides BDU141951]
MLHSALGPPEILPLLGQLIDQSNDLTLVMGPTGEVNYLSSSAQRVLGSLPEVYSWRALLKRVHPDDRSSCLRYGQVMLVKDAPGRSPEIRLRDLRNHWHQYELKLVPLEPSEPTALKGRGSFWGISLRPRPDRDCLVSEVGLSAVLKPLQTRSSFLAVMSHELRTPINAINGFSQLLLRQRHAPLSPQQEDMVMRILTNGKHLLTLINDVLDLSKLEAGWMQLHPQSVNINDLIEGTVQEISSLATQNNLDLEIVQRLDNPVILNDPTRLRQILVNLLSNAIKFTQDGQVWVIVEELNSTFIRISVQDTGPGIALDHLDQVFGEYWQVDQSPSRRHQGTGLGLAICQNLAKLMQGTIQVHSELGQGATFRLTIPRVVRLPGASVERGRC